MKSKALIVTFIALTISTSLFAAESTEKKTEKTTTQQVGGLLFDVDEGVEIEKGGGGSVYVKSNREYMQQKFDTIDARLQALEERMARMEALQNAESGGSNPAKKEEDTRRVLTA